MPEQQIINLAVEGMRCKHCAAAIKDRLGSFPGVAAVEIDLASGKVTVKGNGLDGSYLAREIDALGYTAEVRS